MAFEYLTGFYLLTNQLNKFAAMMERMNDFNYVKIPRAYEEAMLLYSYQAKKDIVIPGKVISEESRKRFSNFLEVLVDRYRADKNAAYSELARDYGDSYFFYSLYGQSGLKQ
jgi:hypothetical protein